MDDELLTNLGKVAGGTFLGKEIIKQSQSLLSSLFGPSINEYGGMLSDNIKLRRLKNQIKIFKKAEHYLKSNNIDPKSLNLKVLAPLVEFSSLEEEESIQDKWSNLTINILKGDSAILFHQNCISVLNKLSTEEVTLLDYLYLELQKKRDYRRNNPQRFRNMIARGLPSTSFTFTVSEINKEFNKIIVDIDLCLSNLLSFGLIKWDTDVEVTAQKSSEEPDDMDIDVDINVYNHHDFVMTKFCEKFVEICKEVKNK